MSIIAPFSVAQLHWHELFISCRERTTYHYEGFGGELPRRSPIPAAFDHSLGAQGWRLVSVRAHHQSDGSSCGVWLQSARDAWLAYVASPSYGTRTFPTFLMQRFEAAGAQNLTGLRGTARSTAERANVAFILEQRADMRGRLVQAALADKLAWGQASLAGFAPATALDLVDFDDPVPE